MSTRTARNLLLLLLPLAGLYLAAQSLEPRQAVFSRWAGPGQPGAVAQAGLSGRANPLVGRAEPLPPAGARLEAFNAASSLQESAADGRVRLFRRAIGGGELAYVVVALDPAVHVQLITADGATPGSDASGDTIWLDGQRHLATVAEMAAAPYAARPDSELLAAMAFGFHGAERTSNEGSVVINGVVHRANPWRGALCITPERRAIIGLFSAEELAGCAQAVGGGPVILWQGRVASTSAAAPTADRLPFNPLGEDFVQLDWRKKIYDGRYPKTAVCVGVADGGGSFLVLANSSNMVGEDLATALRDMGCHDALGGDDDTSTQLVWRGAPVWERQVRAVPDAIAVYAPAP